MSWIKSLWIIIIATLTSLIIAEALLILFWENPFKDTRSSKIVEMRMQSPNIDTQKNRQWLDKKQPNILFRTDKNSFIQPSNQYKKPEKTIMFMGGSTTECSYVKEELRFPNHVSTLFKEGGQKINTINVGRSGNTLHDTINLFLNEMHKHKPDYVVVMHASNDKGVLQRDQLYTTRMAKEVTKTQIVKWLFQSASSQINLFGLLRQSITHLINKRGQKVKLDLLQHSKSSGTDFLPFKQRLMIFVNMARSLGIEPILMTQPMSSSILTEITPQWINKTDQTELNTIIRKVGFEKNVLVIDLSSDMNLIDNYKKSPKDYHYDGIHVTDKGSLEYANIFYKTFSRFLEKSAGEKP